MGVAAWGSPPRFGCCSCTHPPTHLPTILEIQGRPCPASGSRLCGSQAMAVRPPIPSQAAGRAWDPRAKSRQEPGGLLPARRGRRELTIARRYRRGARRGVLARVVLGRVCWERRLEHHQTSKPGKTRGTCSTKTPEKVPRRPGLGARASEDPCSPGTRQVPDKGRRALEAGSARPRGGRPVNGICIKPRAGINSPPR